MNSSWSSQPASNRTNQRGQISEYWTSWFDVDTPGNGGDFETVDNIQQIFGDICQKGYQRWSAQCRVAESGLIFDQEVGSNLTDRLDTACTVQGLVCRDTEQLPTRSLCQDYSIRFLCQYVGEAATPSAPSSTRKTSDNSTGRFSEFDVRIYVILALVPVLLFLARVLWVYLCRRYNSKPGPLDPDLEAATSQEDQPSSSTVMSELSKSPPSYLDLFGTLGKCQPESSTAPVTETRVLVCDVCMGSACSVAQTRAHHLELSFISSVSHGHSSNQATCSEDASIIESDLVDPGHTNATTVEANILSCDVVLSSDRSQSGGRQSGNRQAEGNDIEMSQVGEINLVEEVNHTGEGIKGPENPERRADQSHYVIDNPETQDSRPHSPPPSPPLTSYPSPTEEGPSSLQSTQTPKSDPAISGSCSCSCHKLLVGYRPDSNLRGLSPTSSTYLQDFQEHKLYSGVHKPVLDPIGPPDMSSWSSSDFFSEPPAYEDALRILKLMGGRTSKSE